MGKILIIFSHMIKLIFGLYCLSYGTSFSTQKITYRNERIRNRLVHMFSTSSVNSKESNQTPLKKPATPKKKMSNISSNLKEMMNHEILKKAEERELCIKIRKMQELQHTISHAFVDDLVLCEESICVKLNHLDDEYLATNLNATRKEVTKMINEGRAARDKLIRCNLKLVVSIAKRWLNSPVSSVYAPVYSDIVTLEELVQEGVLGLSRALDKYDVTKNFRFTTYATFWITNFIRNCVQDNITGCLHIPSNLHVIRNNHNTILRRSLEQGQPPPKPEQIAKDLGITVDRLCLALVVAQNLLSLELPIKSAKMSDDSSVILLDTLQCSERRPEEVVELSLLRQSLEHAMASELSPHERDIVRLRLGLDDGQARTAKEVSKVYDSAVSIQGVRSVERRAYKKLRLSRSMHSLNLLAFLDHSEIQNIRNSNI